MIDKIHLKLCTPVHCIFEGDILSANLPGSNGEFGVLAQHCNFLALLKEGVAKVRKGEELHRFYLDGGVAFVTSKDVHVVSENALSLNNITKEELDSQISEIKNSISLETDKIKILELEKKLQNSISASRYL